MKALGGDKSSLKLEAIKVAEKGARLPALQLLLYIHRNLVLRFFPFAALHVMNLKVFRAKPQGERVSGGAGRIYFASAGAVNKNYRHGVEWMSFCRVKRKERSEISNTVRVTPQPAKAALALGLIAQKNQTNLRPFFCSLQHRKLQSRESSRFPLQKPRYKCSKREEKALWIFRHPLKARRALDC